MKSNNIDIEKANFILYINSMQITLNETKSSLQRKLKEVNYNDI